MSDPLRPDERRLINYHRANLAKGGMPEGNSITTFKGARIGVNEGTLYTPTYFNGKVHEDENEILNHAKRTGLYAMYPTDKAANDAEFKLHEIMRRDTDKYMAARQKPMSKLMGMKK